MRVRLMVTGRSYHATDSLPEQLELPEGSTVADAVRAVRACSTDASPLSDSCLIAVSGTHLGTLGRYDDRPLRDGEELTLIAPVAGG